MTQRETRPIDLYEEIVRLRREGQRGALATIVRRVGSTPRKDNAKMLILEDGSVVGTVGGGCVEAEIWELARKVIESRRAELLKYQMTDEDARQEGLICGGTVEIFVEPILPDPSLIIIGAGHVGHALAEAAVPLGFQVSVVDDRESFANRDRFPLAEQILVQPLETAMEGISSTSESFILVVTRGHSHDQVALRSALLAPARYVGLVGSRRKIKIIVENLIDEGLSVDLFSRLYAPIGLEIGSETPQEIAVAVMAELIALQKGCHQRSPKQDFIHKFLQERVTTGRPTRTVR